MSKRIVVWGTGVVGKMVIAEIMPHPKFELVGVGVSNPDKVGRDAGDICGIERIGITATDDLEALIALRPDAVVHYGPTGAHADENIRVIGGFLRAGIDVCSTAMTPWVWPAMKQNPQRMDRTDRGRLPGGRGIVLHHRHRSGLRQRPVSHDADGTVRRGEVGARQRTSRLHRLRG